MRERLATNLSALDGLTRRCPGLATMPAAGGWVAVLSVPCTRSDDEWAMAMLDRGVVVHPGHFFDFEDEGHLVVSLIVEPEPFAAGLERLEALATAS